jgi:hypothetical protein
MDDIFWWHDKAFQVMTKDIPMHVQRHMGDHILICKVAGADHVLSIHQIEIVGGDQDGVRFDVGFGWVEKYIQPSGDTELSD